jgi:hypothetical protein
LLTPQKRLTKQLKDLDIQFTDDFPSALKETDLVVDSIFGEAHLMNSSNLCFADYFRFLVFWRSP